MTDSDPGELADAVTEQLMRASDDLSAVASVVAHPLASTGALAAVGRLLPTVPVAVTVGSPIAVWCGLGPLDPAWRDRAPALPGCLWEQLVTLEALHGDAVDETGSLLDRFLALEETNNLS